LWRQKLNNIISTESFFEELEKCNKIITDHISQEKYLKRFQPSDVKDAATLYLNAGGKRLRPAIMMWSCGAVGGDIEKTIPAASAVEIFHTWTLVHDDIIDRDKKRRGVDTVHERFRGIGVERYGLSESEAAHYGKSVAILAGDVQHGWNVSLLTELTTSYGIDASITLELIREMNNNTINDLIEGELLDLQYSGIDLDKITVDDIERMLWKKTSALYKFCAYAGALLGIGIADPQNEYVQSLALFAEKCGLAFQLQDDILGVVGDTKVTGKSVGNDIREGKRTTVLHFGWSAASDSEKEIISRSLGNLKATDDEIKSVISIIEKRGGVASTKARAENHLSEANRALEIIPNGYHKELLMKWSDYMVNRVK
jgi:geranylgeranyl diphosphate synthase, type I